jgi:2-dehydro-3-deoxyphosphogluconate aldolase/(4S)-4-hydroxy-2-oxoglutarate aldolase
MKKLSAMTRIVESGVIAVVRAESSEQALKIAEAVKAGGVVAIEITMTVPGALHVIEELAGRYSPEEMLIGAGTVLDAETAVAAVLAGAEFLVSPALDPGMIKAAHRYQKVCMAGAMTPGEVIAAMESGCDFVKLFPGSLLGPEGARAIKGPLPQAPLIPTGGVSLENVADWIRAGCEAVGVGGELTAGARSGDYAAVTTAAKQFTEAVRSARGAR